MTSATLAHLERAMRQEIRLSLTAWARFALAPFDQVPAAHHLAILNALETLERGETKRLMLLLPPGSAKSTYASQLFPAWWLSRNPSSAVIAASHTAGLAEHFGRKVRGLIETHAARLNLSVRADARAAGRFLTDRGGEYFAIGINGAVAGRRADLALVDDPVRSFAEAESRSARDRLWNWYRAELMTRLKPKGRVVLAMTRWHSDDLAGRLIEQGGWQVLRLPALAECEDFLGRAPGDALWPEWEGRAELLEKRATMGERSFMALFQQSPLREEGRLFDPSKLRIVDIVPSGTAVRAWDLAASAALSNDPDWTVGVRLVRSADNSIFVDDVVRLRGDPADVVAAIQAAAAADGTTVAIGLPQDPGQAGKSQILFLTQALIGYRVVSSPETGSKEVRAMPLASQVSGGNVSLRRAHWNAVLLDEMSTFPNGPKDDQVDALSRGFAMLTNAGRPAKFVTVPHFVR